MKCITSPVPFWTSHFHIGHFQFYNASRITGQWLTLHEAHDIRSIFQGNDFHEYLLEPHPNQITSTRVLYDMKDGVSNDTIQCRVPSPPNEPAVCPICEPILRFGQKDNNPRLTVPIKSTIASLVSSVPDTVSFLACRPILTSVYNERNRPRNPYTAIQHSN
jgi:hypothetical protein